VSRPASDDNARRTRAEQNADSGRRLLKALVDLMAEKGYNATSAAEIGVRAGFSRAMVHARFGTKDALLDELLRAEWEQRFLGGVVDGLTGLQRVLAYADQFGQLADEDEQFLRAMFVLSFEAARGSAVGRPRIVRFLEELEAAVADAMTAGQTDGSVRADVQPSDAARECMINGCGIAYVWVVLPGADLRTELARWRTRIVADYGRTPSTFNI